MVLVARKTSKTTHAFCARSRSASAANSAGAKRTSNEVVAIGRLVRLDGSVFPARSHIMKKILLRVTRVATKIVLGETLQFEPAGTTPRKVKLAQGLHDPDIHRERGLKPVGEEQNAIRDLWPDARKFQQSRARFVC